MSDTFEGSFGQSVQSMPGGPSAAASGKVGHAKLNFRAVLSDIHETSPQKIQNRPYDEAVELEGSLDERYVFQCPLLCAL